MSSRRSGTRATLGAVARAAGVSLPTVSKVLNGRSDVSSETRERVQRLLDEFEYTARPGRRTPAPAKRIGLVFDALENVHSMAISRGVLAAAAEAGVDITVTVAGGGPRGAAALTRAARSSSAGLILVAVHLSAAQRSHLVGTGIPLVAIDGLCDLGPRAVNVSAANWQGALTATEHLLGLGHRRIAGIFGDPQSPFESARLHGYRAALANAGIDLDGDLVSFGPRPGYARHRSREVLGRADRPTAVFASSDAQALGVLAAAYDLGLHTPRDLSVVSFDDTIVAQFAAPRLTCVRQPFTEMGRVAVRSALTLAARGDLPALRFELATTLVVRESTSIVPARFTTVRI